MNLMKPYRRLILRFAGLLILGATSGCAHAQLAPATASGRVTADSAQLRCKDCGTGPADRPQTPKPPFPYRIEEVAFESAPGVRLAGTLTTPIGPGPFPAVVLVAGSGPHDRNGGGGSWTPMWVIADYLARHGIAALRYDKRGVGQSTGDFAASTTADFANDAESAVHFLQRRGEVARDRVGIIGHSEGGLIAPMVAARTSDVAFVVLLAGPGLPGDSLLLLQRAATDRANGKAPELDPDLETSRRGFAAMRAARDSSDMAARLVALQEEIVATLPADARADARRKLEAGRARLLTPFGRFLVLYDPRPALRQLRVPVLALNGTLDVQVPYEPNLAEIEAALKAGGNRDYQVVAMPGLNHLFQAAVTGSPEEYGTLPDIVSTKALAAMTSWIETHTRAKR